uniref:hypothetical protein n=1 Tax=Comamonas halotolerans TaxID=3041496 RepID=UPI0024E181E9
IALHTDFDVVVHHALDWDQYLHGLFFQKLLVKTFAKAYTLSASSYEFNNSAIVASQNSR